MYPFAPQFVQSGKTVQINWYNGSRRKIQKAVLLRLRLAASVKAVLNAPAFACVAKPEKGARTWSRQRGAKISCRAHSTPRLPTASMAASAGIWFIPPNGKERETCEKVRRIIPHELMQDAFVMQKEFWFKRDGAWSLQTNPCTRNISSSLRTMPQRLIGLWPN